MDTVAIRFVFILTIFNVLLVHCEGSNRRFLNQLNSFKNEIREDLSYIHTDISTLFETVDDLKKPGSIDREYPRGNKTKAIEEGGNCAANCREVTDETRQVNAAILKALESEKRLNRQLQDKLQSLESEHRNTLQALDSENKNKLQALDSEHKNKLQALDSENKKMITKLKAFEDALSDIVVDMDTFLSFMTYVNDTLQKPVPTKPTDNQGYSDVGSTQDYMDETTTATTVPIPSKTTTDVRISTRETKAISDCTKAKKSGVFDLYLESMKVERSVYCDADTDDGGWLVIMRRQDGSVDFDRTWNDYKHGFGNIDAEFWIGNDIIHALTKSKSAELRIDMEDYYGNKAYAKYSRFEIGSEAENYVLHVGGYSGTAGDSLANATYPGRTHNGMAFSTSDKDNDMYWRNCAELFPGGWWYNSCFISHLTGIYGGAESLGIDQGIFWSTWKGWNSYLKYVDMKIR